MEQESVTPRQFGKIILTLENSLLPESKLRETPSQQDGLDEAIEKDLRILGCELIQVSGILLKLPQVAMATGQVLFQRFYYSKSFRRYSMETTAMSCICLASKIEEAPRRVRDVINVFHHIKQVRGQKPIHPMILDGNYVALKSQVIKAERRVLKELGFCVHVKHPHKLIVMYLQVLGYEQNQRLMQMAWNFMNDSLRTDVFVRYNPESIACACIYLTARKLNLPLPNSPPWYGVFKVTEDDITDISYKIMDLYRRPKPNAEALELAVDNLKKEHEEIRNKSKTAPPPPVAITVDRNDSSHNAWGGFISRAAPQGNVSNGLEKNSQHNQSLNQSGVSQSNDTSMQSNQTPKAAASHPRESSHDNANAEKSSKSRDHQSKRSRSRSTSSRSQSHTSSDTNRSRNHKRNRHRSRSRSRSRTPKKHHTSSKKKSSRNYSRSASPSPRRDRDKSDKKHFRSSDKHREYKRDRHSDKDRFSRHDRFSNRDSSSGRGHRSHQDRFRDRKR